MRTNKIAILQSNYVPWKGYFDLIDSVDVFVIYDEVQYTKNDWRNRNIIKTRTGRQWITLPVRQASLSQRICDTYVTSTNWNIKHWHSLKMNYARASSFGEVRDFVEALYLGTAMPSGLSTINKRFLGLICKFLGIKTEIVDSTELNLTGDRNARLLDACMKLNATAYVSGPAARGYLDVQLFRYNGIAVEWMDYSGYPEYPQLFPPFAHDVSILDVILNTGASARQFIKKAKI